jgi:hypothetical protein
MTNQPEFFSDKDADAKVSNAIAICGITRSGTTIMGKLVHSCRGVEYAFEPEILVRLMLLAEAIPRELWRLLYETILHEQILMESIAGRSLNFNANDDSCIFSTKSLREISERFSRGQNRYKQLAAEATQATIAYKFPNVLTSIPFLQSLYPRTRIVVMLRHPDAVVLSLKRKGWFKRDIPLYRETGLLKRIEGQVIPAVVDDDMATAWSKANETDRCYLLYIQNYESLARINNPLVVDYGRFVDRPHAVFEKLIGNLALQPGENTARILAGVSEPHAAYTPPPDGDSALRAKAKRLYEQWSRSDQT